MNEPKPFASLSPTLLARKGSARPAMRPQHATLQPQGSMAHAHDDLGWNDMGHDHHGEPQPVAEASAETAPRSHGYAHLTPAVSQAHASDGTPVPHMRVFPPATAHLPADVVPIAAAPVPQSAPVPPVVHQQAEVASRVGATRETPAPPRRSALGEGRRAAFTLRLDADRHLKLRLACTLAGRSAQMLVTDALDRLIADLPDVDTLAAQVRKRS